MYKFVIGDKVRRKPEDQNMPWEGGGKVFTVHSIEQDSLNLVGIDNLYWDSQKFELVECGGAPPNTPSALSTQVGGDHYKSLTIQPIEYITKNNLSWCEGNVIKYISRWKQKGQHADLDKVIHYVNLLKELNV